MSNEKAKLTLSPQLLWATEYEFTSSYSMDECVAHLNSLNAKYQKDRLSFWKTSTLNFEKLADNGGIVQFEIKGNMSRALIEAASIGQLIYKDHNNAIVKLRIGIIKRSALTHHIPIGMINLILGLIFTLGYESWLYFLFMLFLDAILLLGSYEAFSILRYDIYTSVNEALTIKPAPRPMTLPR